MSCEKIVSQEINLNTSVNVHLRDSSTLPAPWITESCIEIKINLNFYYHPSMWCLERFFEGPGPGRVDHST